MPSIPNAIQLKQASSLQQPKFGCLVRELRRLTKLTQGQFAAAIGFMENLGKFAPQAIQDRSKALLDEYFAEMQA